MHYYSLYSLIIKSEFELEHLHKTEKSDEIDVVIKSGKIEIDYSKISGGLIRPRIRINNEHVLLKIDNIASFYFNEKNCLIIEMENGISIDKAMPYFYGTMVSCILHRFELFPLHASAINYYDKGLVLFSGDSGVGKSTIATKLHENGHLLHSDDKSVLKWNDEQQCFYAQTSYKLVKLWNETIKVLNSSEELQKNKKPIDYKIDKYLVELSDNCSSESIKVSSMYAMIKTNRQRLRIGNMTMQAKLKFINQSFHRRQFIVGEKQNQAFERFKFKLIQEMPFYLIAKPNEIPIEEFTESVLEHLKKEYE